MVWSSIILEGYCLFDYLSKKKHVYYKVMDVEKLKFSKKGKTYINKKYIPPKERPNWCKKQNKKKIPQFRCLCYGNNKKCPFFAFANAPKEDYRFLDKKFNNT